jgi:hypothetical protein
LFIQGGSLHLRHLFGLFSVLMLAATAWADDPPCFTESIQDFGNCSIGLITVSGVGGGAPGGIIGPFGNGLAYLGPLPAGFFFTLSVPAGYSIDTSNVVGSVLFSESSPAIAGLSDEVDAFGPGGQFEGDVTDETNTGFFLDCAECGIADKPLGPICGTCEVTSVFVSINTVGDMDSLDSLAISGFLVDSPEPGSLVLFGTVIACLAFAIRRSGLTRLRQLTRPLLR